jgi:cell division protein FtsB
MPAASASYRATRRRTSRATPALAAVGRIRWDRVGRIAMLTVLVALLFLYLSTGLRMFSTWREAQRTSARVSTLEAEHRRLTGQHARLGSQSTLESQARQLGMIRPGEQPYVVSGLPGN